MSDAVVGRPTAFRVVNLDEPSRWTVRSDGAAPLSASVVERGLEIRTIIGPNTFTVTRS